MNYEALPLDYKKTFSRYINLLKIFGIDFFNGSRISTNSKIRLLLFNVIFIPFVFSQFMLLTNIAAENFLESAQIIPVTAMFVLDVIKMSIALVKRSEIKNVVLEIGELWPTGLQDDDEKAITMKIWMRRIRTFLNVFFIYALVNLFTFEVIPMLMTFRNIYVGCVGGYVFPFQFVGFWEVNSTMTYIMTYLWECLATIPCQLFLYLPYDLLIVAITTNVSILFRMLQEELKLAIMAHNDERKLCVSEPKSTERIFRIVKDHQKLLRISRQLNDIFGLVIFIHVAFSSVLICFFGFLTTVFGGLAETVSNLLTVWNAVITIFLLALSGQLLCDTSSGMADAAYQSLWYDSDIKVQKLVLFVMIRSNRISYLSALGFSDITLRSFSKIMSSAWTYFSLLIQMYRER